MILDTSGILAALADDQAAHASCREAILAARGPLLLSPFVLAELYGLVARCAGLAGKLSLLDEIAGGAYQLAPIDAADIARARAIIARHAGLGLSLADASIVLLSERHDVCDVLTLDVHRFRAIEAAGGKPFRVLPADA